jgi:uncharacterized protein YbgA (DUF1722 family)
LDSRHANLNPEIDPDAARRRNFRGLCASTPANLDSTDAGPENGAALGKTSGLFAEAAIKRFPHLAIEDDARLSNQRIREHFLTRIFAFARLRALRQSESMHALVRLHSAHKFLPMSHSEQKLCALGRIVANAGKQSSRRVLESTRRHSRKRFNRSRGRLRRSMCLCTPSDISRRVCLAGRSVTFLMFSVLTVMAGCRCRALPACCGWALRFDSMYLQEHVFFRPFPDSLLAIEDSGKGRNLSSRSVA